MSNEFIVRDTTSTKSEFVNLVHFMASRDLLTIDNQIVSVNLDRCNQETAQTFLNHFIMPFIESYWLTLAFLATKEKLD